MAWILIAIGAITIWAASLFKIFISSPCVPSNLSFLSKNGSTNKYGEKRNVLLVIAHPDDESMFFAPTLLFLASQGHSLHVLCLSTGNAEGKGNVRKEELYRACATLKVPQQQVKILDHPNLQDGFHHPWDRQLIATIVEEEIKSCNVDSVRFDLVELTSPSSCFRYLRLTNLVFRAIQITVTFIMECAIYSRKVHKRLKLGNLLVTVSFLSILAQWLSGYQHAFDLAKEKEYIA